MKEDQDDGDAAKTIERRSVSDQRAVSYRVRLWSPSRAALAAVALIVLIEVIIIVPTAHASVIIATAAWLTMPGVALVRPLFVHAAGSRLSAWLVGPALGFGFSVFGLLLIWAAGVQNWFAILIAPVLTWLLAWTVRRWGGPSLRVPACDRRDVLAVAAALLVVPLITFTPYDHVAERVADGDAYRAYFTADFVWAMTVTAELAKGDVPPVNPFLTGETVKYYWMSHLLSGALYRNLTAAGVTAEQVVLVNGLLFGLAFVAFFYWLARAAGASPAFAALAVIIAFVANSYEGVERLWSYWSRGRSLEMVTTINIDAVTRWFYQGMPVDGLQRLLLYQPHHLTGYALALAALWLVSIAEDVTQVSVALWAGFLLGLAFLFSTFTAIIVGAGLGVLYLVRLLSRRAYGDIWRCAVLGAAPIAIAIGTSAVLGYTDADDGFLIEFGLNPIATERWPFMLFLSFGPLVILGVSGLLRPRWVIRDGLAAAALVLSAIVFYFIADVPDMNGVWVGWRSGHLLLIAFAVIAAAALTRVWERRVWRIPMATAVLLLSLLAVPTVAIDVYNAQDITNRGPGPTFPWTIVLTPAEREGLAWIRQNTPPDAVVQVDPTARGPAGWAYVPAYAERRMAAGLPISMIPLRPYELATEVVRAGIFVASTVKDAHAIARSLGVDYLLVGAPERQMYPGIVAELEKDSRPFAPVFHNEAMTVYRVAK